MAKAGDRVKDVRVTDDLLSVDLIDGRTISVPLALYPRLLHASEEQRGNWRIAGGGFGIHWPDLDEDLSTERLLRGAPAPRAFATSAAAYIATPRPEPAYRIEWEEQDAVIRFRRDLVGLEDVTRLLGSLSLDTNPHQRSEADEAALAEEVERAAQNRRLERERP